MSTILFDIWGAQLESLLIIIAGYFLISIIGFVYLTIKKGRYPNTMLSVIIISILSIYNIKFFFINTNEVQQNLPFNFAYLFTGGLTILYLDDLFWTRIIKRQNSPRTKFITLLVGLLCLHLALELKYLLLN